MALGTCVSSFALALINTGSAKMTAVSETDAGMGSCSSCAPIGNARDARAAGLTFAFAPRRTGANASAADHPV